MINYSLVCHDCNQEFDSWFGGSIDYETQKENGLLQCPLCESENIDKAIMSPRINKSKENGWVDTRTILRQTKQYIEEHFEDVGNDFADEAISINNGDSEYRNIYGKINGSDEDRLQDEGIEYIKIPWIEQKDQ